jgi:hypothetical protein
LTKPRSYDTINYQTIKEQKMFRYDGEVFEKLEEAEEAVMIDFPWAMDDELCDLFDIYIEED